MAHEAKVHGRSLTVVMPVFNEGSLVSGFLRELDKELSAWEGRVDFIVVNDASTDDTADTVRSVALEMSSPVKLIDNEVNQGHGPSVARGYAEALATGSDYILQTDSDAPFFTAQIWDLLAVIERGGDIAHGVRCDRSDPWFRKLLTLSLRWYLRVGFSTPSSDPNSPVRLFERNLLSRVSSDLPNDPLVPSLFATVLSHRYGAEIVEVEIRHRARDGISQQGSTWGPRERRVLVPRRLVSLVVRALVQTLRFKANRGAGLTPVAAPAPGRVVRTVSARK